MNKFTKGERVKYLYDYREGREYVVTGQKLALVGIKKVKYYTPELLLEGPELFVREEHVERIH